MRTCLYNSSHAIPDDADPRQLYCSPTCRAAHYKARTRRDASRTREAVALLRRQTLAVERRDGAALAAATREARTLLSALLVP